jgi:hypothetical protein
MPGKRWTRRRRREDREKEQKSDREMTVGEILEELRYYGDGAFPRTALQQAVANEEAITPELLSILDGAAEDPEGLPRGYMAHTYAMFLLAQFREERAYPLLVDFASTPGEIVMDLCGETVTEDLGRILASVSGGDPSLIKSLVEDEEAHAYVRSAALTGLVSLVACGEMSRQELIDYLRRLLHMDIAREKTIVWTAVLSVALDLYPEELYEDIKEAYADGRVNPHLVSLEAVERTLARDKEEVLRRTREDVHHQLVEDVISEMGWWACFDGARSPTPYSLLPTP